MIDLEGRTVAIAGAGGGLGPAVAAASPTPAPRSRSPTSTPAPGGGRRPTSPCPRTASTPASSTCSTPTRPASGAAASRSASAAPTPSSTWSAAGRAATRSRPPRSPTTSSCTTCWSRTVQHATRAFYDALAEPPTRPLRARLLRPGAGPDGTNASYAATKAAAETWTLALADSFRAAESAATANIVVVNAILTPQMREENPDKPYKTFTAAEDIAEAIAFTLLRRGGEDERQAPGASPVSRR